MYERHTTWFVGDLVPCNGRGEVAGVYRHAIHLRWSSGAWYGIVDRRGDRFPWGIQLPDLPRLVEVGMPVTATDEVLRLGRHEVVTLPRRRLRNPTTQVEAWQRSHALVEELLVIPSQALHPLDREVLAQARAILTVSAAAPSTLLERSGALVGAGGGLTPFGDDVLVGVMAGFTAAGQRVATSMPMLPTHRTTELSAWFLEMARCGRFGGALVELSAAIGDEKRLRRALPQLLALGSSSGAGMALGLAMGLQATFSKEFRPCSLTT